MSSKQRRAADSCSSSSSVQAANISCTEHYKLPAEAGDVRYYIMHESRLQVSCMPVPEEVLHEPNTACFIMQRSTLDFLRVAVLAEVLSVC
jgi:hypothetical protein